MQSMILDRKLKALAASERKITYEILLLIQTVDVTKSYRELGFSSLHEYLTKEIGYSEGAAHRRISSARLMKQVPSLDEKIKSGSLNLTQVSLAQVAIRQEEKAAGQKISFEQKTEILEKLKAKSTFETQKILKENLPNFEIATTKALPAFDKDGKCKVHVTMAFSEEDWQKIQYLLAHFSNSVPDQKLENLLLYWFKQVQAKKQKQKKRIAKAESQNNLSQNPTSTAEVETSKRIKFTAQNKQNQRTKSSVKVHIQLREKAKEQCEYVSPLTEKRCCSKHFLEEDHIVPLAKGGSNACENLRLYCRSHNQLMAKLWGVSKN